MGNKRGAGIALSYVFLALNMLIGLFMSSFIIRRLGDTEYGLYQAVGAFANYLVMLEFGTGTVMTRNLSVYRQNTTEKFIRKCISTVWLITIVLSLVIFTIASAFMLNIGTIFKNTMSHEQVIYGQKIFVLIVVNLILSFFQSTANGMLLGYENYTFANKLKLMKLLIRTGIVVAVLIEWPLAIALTIVDCFIALFGLTWTLFYCMKHYSFRIRLKEFDVQILKESLPLCLALLLQTLINQANNEVDKTILGIKMSLESVSIYSVAQYIYSVFSSITTIPISMYMPEVAKNITSGKKGRELTETLIQPCRLVVIFGGMIMFGFVAIGRQFISILYGKKYLPAWGYALIIIVPMFINMTNGVLVNVLDVLKKRMIRSYILLGTTVFNIILTVYLINRIGIIGAVIATAISVLIGQDIFMNLYYSKKLGIHILYLFRVAYIGLIPIEIFACLFSTIVALQIKNNILSLLVGGTSFVLLCAIGFLIFGFNDDEKNLSKTLLRKLR